MSLEPVNLAVIGCEGDSLHWIKRLLSVPDFVALIAVSAVDPTSPGTYHCRSRGVMVIGSITKLLAIKKVEVVFNPTPIHLPQPVTVQCLEAGRQVWLKEGGGRAHLKDGGTYRARDHYEAWIVFWGRWFLERARRGPFIAVSSPTYALYTLSVLQNVLDLVEDAHLHGQASKFFDLVWADRAQDQIGGMRGGAKTRNYAPKSGYGAMTQQVKFLLSGPRNACHGQSMIFAGAPECVVKPGRLYSGAKGQLIGDSRFDESAPDSWKLGTDHVYRSVQHRNVLITQQVRTVRRVSPEWFPDYERLGKRHGILFRGDQQLIPNFND